MNINDRPVDPATWGRMVDSQGPAGSGGFVTFFARQNIVENGMLLAARFFTKKHVKTC